VPTNSGCGPAWYLIQLDSLSINTNMNYNKHKTSNNEYLSPKNGRLYKSLKAFIAHMHFNYAVVDRYAITKRLFKVKCKFCEIKKFNCNIKRHEETCYLNPKNLKRCLRCDSPIKDFKNSRGTCSRACSNVYFKDLRNERQNIKNYRTICFRHHQKECVVCGESKIVAVHHMNENRQDNSSKNLVPLCPTHHQYLHSKYKNEILPVVRKYLKKTSS